MTQDDYKALAPNIPKLPGIYKFLGDNDVIIYVGKAKNLRSRTASYFGSRKHLPYKTRTMVKNSRVLEFTVVETEADALLLENTLIKRLQPRYNVQLKDAKSYTYLCIKNERFPRIFFTRKVIRDGSKYYGPYTSKNKAKQIFDLIKNLFSIRTCPYNLSEENIAAKKFKVCLEYHLKNCNGPCEGLEDEASYNDNIAQVKNILNGNFKPVKDYIHLEMVRHASNLEFERAEMMKEKLSLFEDYQAKSTVVSQSIRDIDVFSILSEEEWAFVNYMKVLNGSLVNAETIELKKNLDTDEKDLLAYVIPVLRERYSSIAPELILPFIIEVADDQLTQTVPKIGDKRKLLDLSLKNLKYYQLQKMKSAAAQVRKQTSSERILRTLQQDLNMDALPIHLECFDNSNIQGSNPVASCVVFKNARPAKKAYRKYNIKTVEGPNDFASMEEVVFRRYKRLLEEKSDLPQLIIIDGGKGQLNAAVQSLKKLDILDRVTIIGIAKRLEEIYFPGDPIPLYINKKSESLKLIQQARNEAHRFAINFHRDRRSKDMLGSALSEIDGIGEKTAEKLLVQFGSLDRIKKLSIEDLAAVVGNQKAHLIKSSLEDNTDEG